MKKLILILFVAVAFQGFAQTTVIINAQIFDGKNEKIITGKDVLIEDNLISEIRANIKVPDGATVIDAGGKTLMPGIMDMHVHYSLYRPVNAMRDELTQSENAAIAAARAQNLLMCGITTTRDTGGSATFLRRAIENHKVLTGPRIYSAEAVITQTTGHGDFRERADRNPNMYGGATHWYEAEFSYICDGPTEIRRAIRENFRRGANFIKVMSTGGVSSQFDPLHSIQFTAGEVAAAVEVADTWGAYVTVHGIGAEGTIQAIEQGVKCVEHGAQLNEPSIKLMQEKGVWLVPSLMVLQGLTEEDARKILDPASYKKWVTVKEGIDKAMKLAVKYDIKMAYGTDVVAPIADPLGSDRSSLKEFNFLVKYMKPWQALKMATGNAGELAAMSGKNDPYQEAKLGMVKAGYYADLLLVDGDPTKDISLVTSPDNFKIIMKDGVIYKNEL